MPVTGQQGGVMPKEKFYPPTAVEGDDTPPTITVAWGNTDAQVLINGTQFDRSGINRLITVARKARDQTYNPDE